MKRKLIVYGLAGLILLILTVLICLGIGSVRLPVQHIAGILIHHLPWIGSYITPFWEGPTEQIIVNVRLPRVLLGMLTGAALALAGAAFQGVLRNPLADPFTLGVSSGASVGAAFLIYWGLQYSFFGLWTLPLVAFTTGILTLYLVILLARENGKIPTQSLILSGVVMQSFLGAVVSFLTAMSKETVNEILYWTMGSLGLKGWAYPGIILPYVILGLILLCSKARVLNMLALGEGQAAYMGVNVDRTKLWVLITATFLTAASVSVCGVIGFVGLVVPHMIRLLTGPDYRLIIPLSALGGAIFIVWADTAARTLLAPTEIPLGVVTAFVGAPFFAYLLQRNKKRRGGELS
ncbi:iron chelate uptake ABC transporter family permease subunit [Paenibacillus sp. P96]|uniref:Iron chelate uptake ABC transporter family permease subunit n=1 Tax=Paenibacillus zeirhizosphaerae TaxID=2987519 RepID=A0ABT9FKQ4_9BACL|nr:iron chelate uptake ABC transporter family permease subunit [Paenibacillus sp. P96]MDP4095309.1 iron chelate uptake ABC transporter family permease subunit [Paenibacillus sp. P96]